MSEKMSMPADQVRKNIIGNICAVFVVLMCILFPVGFSCDSEILLRSFVIINFISGPICFIGYLIEVKRGVFSGEGGDEKPLDE